MSHKLLLSILLISAVALTTCNLPSNGPLPVLPTATLGISTLSPATATNPPPVAMPTITPLPKSITPIPLMPPPSKGSSPYLDDRSNPVTLISSYFNAVNRKEYLRAYSYWRDPETALGTLTNFTNGYANTASVSLVFGTITGDAGAGQMYYTVPVRLKGIASNGVHSDYAACYVVHLSQPGFYGAPPITPMNIDRGTAEPVNVNAADADVLAEACTGPDYPISSPVSVGPSSLDISKNNYLDNRSDPIATVSSYLNALNSKQYVRAYSYSQNPASEFGPYSSYEAGYADTDVITVTFGTVLSDAGAGNLTYKVPLAMKVLTTSAATQTFVGCFTLHLSQPGVQGVYPFQPMGLTAGKFKTVANNVDIHPLLETACN